MGGCRAEEGQSLSFLTIDPNMRSEQILRETGILLVREGNNYISDGIYSDLIKTKCCRKSYLRGIFMGSGTISDPEKSYHLEIVCSSKNLANDLKKMINSFVDLSAKIVERKNHYIVYMKSSEYICDTLAIMGAHSQMLEFENVKIKRTGQRDGAHNQLRQRQHGQNPGRFTAAAQEHQKDSEDEGTGMPAGKTAGGSGAAAGIS